MSLAAALLALGPASSARADLVLVGKDHKSTGYSLVGNDTSEEDNRITIYLDAATARWVIGDEAGVVDGAAECVAISATAASCDAAPFNIVKLETERGKDRVRAISDYAAIGPQAGRYLDLAVGLGRGKDRFAGGDSGDNLAVGGRGRDRLVGGGSFDRLIGGPGADRLVGSRGPDQLAGGGGNDFLFTGPGRKGLMLGGRGKDRCVAGRGSHRVGSCERVTIR